MKPAVFLDRDGTLVEESGYLDRLERLVFYPYSVDAVRALNRGGFAVVVVTNQAGIGRGLFGEADYQAVNRWMCDRFRSEGAPIARVYHCPFHAELGIGEYRIDHAWRKPKPGMILQAAADLDLELSRSVLIGDKLSDIEAAAAAGVPARILLDPLGSPPATTAPEHRIVRNLPEALVLLKEFVASATQARL